MTRKEKLLSSRTPTKTKKITEEYPVCILIQAEGAVLSGPVGISWTYDCDGSCYSETTGRSAEQRWSSHH